MDGQPAGILAIAKQPGDDTIRLTRAVEAALLELQAGMPRGVVADRIKFRQADFIARSIANLQQVLAEAFIFVAIVLFSFLLHTHPTLIPLTAIPSSILLTSTLFAAFRLAITPHHFGALPPPP